MKRRSFLKLMGIAPAAASMAMAREAVVAPEYQSIAIRGDKVSCEPYFDIDRRITSLGARTESDGIAFRAATHSFVDADGVVRVVWIR